MFDVKHQEKHCGSNIYLQCFEFQNGSDKVIASYYSGRDIEPLPSVFVERNGQCINLLAVDDIYLRNIDQEMQNLYLGYLQDQGEIQPLVGNTASIY